MKRHVQLVSGHSLWKAFTFVWQIHFCIFFFDTTGRKNLGVFEWWGYSRRLGRVSKPDSGIFPFFLACRLFELSSKSISLASVFVTRPAD